VHISNPTFPLDIPFEVYVPPCLYQIIVTVFREQGLPQVASEIADACHGAEIDMTIDTFDTRLLPVDTDLIHAPEVVTAGAEIVVSCGPAATDTSLTATLTEQNGGGSASGSIDTTSAISGIFPDPFPVTSSEERRVFKCRVADGQSGSQTFTKAIRREPGNLPITPTLPMTTPTIPAMSPTPEFTQTPNITITPTPLPTELPAIPETPTIPPGFP
jgi:hypothetical protein